MCLMSHWLIIFSITVSTLITTISLGEIKRKMSKITNKRTYCNRTYLTFYQKTFEQLNYLFLTQEQEDELTDEQESPHPEEGVQTNPPSQHSGVNSPPPVEKEKQPQNQEDPPKPHVQNNQVNSSQSQQPIPPSNQINNQLNNQQPDTGEEESTSTSNKTPPVEWTVWMMLFILVLLILIIYCIHVIFIFTFQQGQLFKGLFVYLLNK